jgi:hypothetical protein
MIKRKKKKRPTATPREQFDDVRLLLCKLEGTRRAIQIANNCDDEMVICEVLKNHSIAIAILSIQQIFSHVYDVASNDEN